MQRFMVPVFLGLMFVVTVACYMPGLDGDFFHDDWLNIQNNPHIMISHLDISTLWQAAMSSSAGLLKRPVSMLTFALDYYRGGLNPYYFKISNLAIHLLNGLFLYVLTQLLLGLYQKLHSPRTDHFNVTLISLGVAAIWLLHPFNLTGVLYVVQRMASLSAFFTLIGLILYLNGRKCQIETGAGGWLAITAAVFVCTPLAALSKENGLLLPMFMLLIEMTILQWYMPNKRMRQHLFLFFAATVFLPLLAILLYLLLDPGFILSGYESRDFSLTERLMTQARIIWFYLYMIFLPNISAMGFYHDDMLISRGLLAPATTLYAICGLLVLLIFSWRVRKKHPLILFGVLFFLVGHSMESSVISLSLVYEHRNYLPMYGLLLVSVYYVLTATYHLSSLRWRQIGFLLMTLLFAALTLLRANQWSNPLQMMQMEVQYHPDSVKANSTLAIQYASLPAKNEDEAERYFQKAKYHFLRAASLSDKDTSGYFGVLAINAARGVNTDAAWIDELARRLAQLKPTPGSINSLIAMGKCTSNGNCKHSPDLVELLLEAALSNPTLKGAYRSTVLFALCDFLIKVRHQPEQAIELAFEAVDKAPDNIAQRLTLIAFLIKAKNFDQAAMEITNTRILDKKSIYTPALRQLERQLAEIRIKYSTE